MHNQNCTPDCYSEAVSRLDRVRLREDLPEAAHIDIDAPVDGWIQDLWRSRGYLVGKRGVILVKFSGNSTVYTWPAILMVNRAGVN